MTEAEAIAWFEGLATKARAVPQFPASAGWPSYMDGTKASAWLAEARAALHSVFPAGHALLKSWEDVFERAKAGSTKAPHAHWNFQQSLGVFDGAVTLLKGGRLRSLMDGVRAETVSEVLDQAEALNGAAHVTAAAVLAGGALETHLLHLCSRNGLTWTGDGSISKYDQAIGQARNAGTVEVYPATESKLVISWGGIRNDAAHDPTNFKRSKDDVGRMIEGVREFIVRHP